MIVFLRTGFEIAVRRFCAAAGRRRIGDGPEGFLEYRFPGFEFARSGIHRRFVVGQRDAEGAGQPGSELCLKAVFARRQLRNRQLQRLAGVCRELRKCFLRKDFSVFIDERQIDTALPARFGEKKFELDLPRRMIQCPVEVEVEGSERTVFGFDLLVAQGFFIELHFVDGSEECGFRRAESVRTDRYAPDLSGGDARDPFHVLFVPVPAPVQIDRAPVAPVPDGGDMDPVVFRDVSADQLGFDRFDAAVVPRQVEPEPVPEPERENLFPIRIQGREQKAVQAGLFPAVPVGADPHRDGSGVSEQSGMFE